MPHSEVYAPPQLPEFRSRAEVERYLTEHYPTMPGQVRSVAAESWERRSVQKPEPPSADELRRRLDEAADEIRRDAVQALGREIRQDDAEDDPEDGKDPADQIDNCPKCDSDLLDVSWNSDEDTLAVRCLRCGYEYTTAPMDQRSIRRALQFNQIRKLARGY